MEDREFPKRDMRKNEDPEVVGGAIGAATGAGVGGSLGIALGPIGAVLGVLAGAAGGWWAGRGVEEAVAEVDREDNRFRRAHEHAGATRPYDEARHGYQLGYVAGRNPDYEGRSFPEVEEELRTAWVRAHLQDREAVPWETVSDEVRRGFELNRRREVG